MAEALASEAPQDQTADELGAAAAGTAAGASGDETALKPRADAGPADAAAPEGRRAEAAAARNGGGLAARWPFGRAPAAS